QTGAPPPPKEVAPGAAEDGAQPVAKATTLWLVDEGAHPAGELEQDILGDVFRIDALKTLLPAPAKDHGAVAVHELVPGGLVQRVEPQPAQQADPRGRGGGLGHRSSLR